MELDRTSTTFLGQWIIRHIRVLGTLERVVTHKMSHAGAISALAFVSMGLNREENEWCGWGQALLAQTLWVVSCGWTRSVRHPCWHSFALMLVTKPILALFCEPPPHVSKDLLQFVYLSLCTSQKHSSLSVHRVFLSKASSCRGLVAACPVEIEIQSLHCCA